MKLKLTQGKYAVISASDSWVRWNKWHARYSRTGGWRAVTRLGNQHLYLSRLLLNPQKNEYVIHRNGDTLDYRRSNLSIGTRSDASANEYKRRKHSSRYRGVHYSAAYRGKKKWTACIGIGNKVLTIGRFAKEKEAAKAYDKKAKELFGQFARVNLK